jgi:tRNA dimethylallyltransferase
MTGAGYRETLSYLQGSLSLEETVEEIQKSHRRYARRQTTWYRHQLPSGAHFLDAGGPAEALVGEVLSIWEGALAGIEPPGTEGDHTEEEEIG